MSTISSKNIESALLSKGFRRDNTHHEYLWLYVDGKKTTVKTWLSHGIREYGDDLLAQVKKQLGISKNQLIALVHCPLGHADYVRHLRDTGRIIV